MHINTYEIRVIEPTMVEYLVRHGHPTTFRKAANTPESAWGKFMTQNTKGLIPNKADYTVTLVE